MLSRPIRWIPCDAGRRARWCQEDPFYPTMFYCVFDQHQCSIKSIQNNIDSIVRSFNNNQTQVDLDAELARQLQNGDNDIGRRYDAARFRNNNRNGNRGRGRGRGRSNNRRRVRVNRNNNNNNNNNGWQDAGLFFQNDGVSDNRFNTYEEMLALDENNVKVGLKKNVSNSIFYYNIILI